MQQQQQQQQQQHPTAVKPVAITKAQLTTQPSLVHWKQVYGPLLPAFHQHFAAAASTGSAKDNDPAAAAAANSPSSSSATTVDDDEAIRCLAEWGGDVAKAVAHCRDTQAWRRAALPIPRGEVVRTVETHKLLFLGFDRVGRPVCYYRTRLHDPRAFTPEETVRAVVYLYEELQALARRPGFRGIREEVCVVVDRTEGKPANFDVEFVKLFISTFKQRYPSRLEIFLIYPSNFVFKAIWACVKPFLDAKSRGSTFLLQSKAELLEFIAEDQLADFVGGSLHYEPGKEGEEVKNEGAMTA